MTVAKHQVFFAASFTFCSLVTATCPSPHFQAVGAYTGLSNGRAVEVSDLNLDGHQDLIVERLNGTVMTLSIFGYGPNGRTDLTTVGAFRLPSEFSPMRFGNLNADLAPDLVMMSPNLRRISVYMNSGAGGFANPVNITLPADLPSPGLSDIGLVDFDGDSDLDIIATLSNSPSVAGGATGVLLIYKNNGSGTFIAPTSAEYYYPGPIPRAYLGAAHMDGDSLIDLMFLNTIANAPITYLLRRQGGAPENLNMNPIQVGFIVNLIDGRLVDFDHQNFFDTVSINAASLYIRLTSPTGSLSNLASQLTYTPGLSLDKVRSTDLNNDGWADIVLNSNTAFDAQNSSIGVYMNQGNGLVFGTGNVAFTQLSSRGLNPVAPVFADMDLDGDQDMAVLNTGSSSLSVFYNSCVPSCDINGDLKEDIEDLYFYHQEVLPAGLANPLADYNRDGVLDGGDTNAVEACLRRNELEDMAAGRR
jgi:hypothetical protein